MATGSSRACLTWACSVTLWLTLLLSPVGAQPAPVGLVIEAVEIGGAAARTDLQPGDLLLEWRSRENIAVGGMGSMGPLLSPFDLRRVEILVAPRSAIDLVTLRGSVRRSVEIPAGELGLRVRPTMSDAELALYETAIETGAGIDMAAGQELARLLAASGNDNAVWLWSRLGDAAEPDAEPYRQAKTLAEQAGPETLAALLEWRASTLDDRGVADAPAAWRDYLAFLESQGETGLALARGLYMLGTWEGRRGDLEYGAELVAQALEIQRELAPSSIELAETMIADGISHALHGDLDGADESFAAALKTARARDAGAGAVAAAHIALGNVAQRRGTLESAGQHFAEALRINRAINPGGLNVGFALNNLGIVAEETGDLALAGSYYQQSLAIKRATAPGSMHVPRALENLAYVAIARGDYVRANDLQSEALALYETLAPGNLVLSTSLKLLGRINEARGEYDAARDYWLRAQELEGELAPTTLSYAEILAGLAGNAEGNGQISVAGDYEQQALAIREQVAPASLAVAASLYNLGRLAAMQGNPDQAEQRLTRARALFSRLAPGTAREANAFHALGELHRDSGRNDSALAHFRRALNAIELQRGKLGGTDPVRAQFAAKYGHLYKDTIDLLLQRGETEEAFEVLERYRARSLLAMLAGRNVDLGGSLPATLAKRRSDLNREYDQTTAELQSLGDTPDNRAAVDELLARLRALRNDREQLADSIRFAVPRVASVESPRPLSVTDVHALLQPGTTLLSFDIGEQRSHLFALARRQDGSTAFSVQPITANLASLAKDVTAVRLLMQLPDGVDVSTDRLAERTYALYQQLLEPAADILAGSNRLVIVPDGPLHRLAFPALVVQPPAAGKPPHYLIEDAALHTVVSATLLGELRDRQTAATGDRLVAFADPAWSTTPSASDPAFGNRAVESLDPLPYARREAEAIATLYSGSSRLLLDDAATELEAKELGSDARYIHFASHGVLNQRSPLDSFLLLSPTAGEDAADNGLLQAWEVFEQLRIGADLVTLSACDTGIGTDGGGEGLIGLTRAFHYAGAKSVLASLWSVSDRSTERLMTGLYNRLRDGATIDEALRQSQLELIHHEPASGFKAALRRLTGDATRSSLSHPFHWAAFQLSGDPVQASP